MENIRHQSVYVIVNENGTLAYTSGGNYKCMYVSKVYAERALNRMPVYRRKGLRIVEYVPKN